MNVNVIPKCIRKLILLPCVTSKYSVLIFPRLSQWLCPTKRATNTAVDESGHRAGSKSWSNASGERGQREARSRAKGAAVCSNSWTNRDWQNERTLCCKTSIPSSSTSHQCKRLSQGREHPIWQTQVCTGKTWATRCTPWAGRWPTGPGTSEQGFEKSFQGPCTKSPFRSAP